MPLFEKEKITKSSAFLDRSIVDYYFIMFDIHGTDLFTNFTVFVLLSADLVYVC